MKFRKKKAAPEIQAPEEKPELDSPEKSEDNSEKLESLEKVEDFENLEDLENLEKPEEKTEEMAKETFLQKWSLREDKDASALAVLREAAEEEGEEAKRLAMSLERIDGFRDGGDYKEEDIDAALGLLLDIAAEGSLGAVAPENLELLLKGARYDGDLDKARMQGEVAGRNAVIEERLQQPPRGDGVPRLGGSSASADSRRPDTIFDLASFAR